MQIFHTLKETKAFVRKKIRAGESIGFVPTMGALHNGHISLIDKARVDNDVVIASIFVNPTQFGNPEDLKKYPRTLEADTKLLEPAGCDVIFAPSPEEMYPSLPKLTMNFGKLETVMEGKFRTGHFSGVGTVVAKLFHIINPDRAYFGLKDLQQVAILKRLVADLSFDLELIPCPIVREKDGLAMSSRNRRLSEEARLQAPQISIALQQAKEQMLNGDDSQTVKASVAEYFAKFLAFELEYFEISDFDNLVPILERNEEGKTAFCIAAYLDNVRLIDNVVF